MPKNTTMQHEMQYELPYEMQCKIQRSRKGITNPQICNAFLFSNAHSCPSSIHRYTDAGSYEDV